MRSRPLAPHPSPFVRVSKALMEASRGQRGLISLNDTERPMYSSYSSVTRQKFLLAFVVNACNRVCSKIKTTFLLFPVPSVVQTHFSLRWWEHFTSSLMQWTATMPIISRLMGPNCTHKHTLVKANWKNVQIKIAIFLQAPFYVHLYSTHTPCYKSNT